MKAGANFQDVNEIKALYAQGKSAEEISRIVRIELECVASFAPVGDEAVAAEAAADAVVAAEEAAKPQEPQYPDPTVDDDESLGDTPKTESPVPQEDGVYVDDGTADPVAPPSSLQGADVRGRLF